MFDRLNEYLILKSMEKRINRQAAIIEEFSNRLCANPAFKKIHDEYIEKENQQKLEYAEKIFLEKGIDKEILKEYSASNIDIQREISSLKSRFKNSYKSPEYPIAIFTGGQPGCGKGLLVARALADFEENNMRAFVFDVDSFRNDFYNAYSLAYNYPEYYQDITNPFAQKIMEESSKYAIENNCNFIVEGTMGKSINTLEYLLESSKKYRVVARLMAVPREESLINIFERYIEKVEKYDAGRLTSVECHDDRYTNFPNIASKLEGMGIEVEVYEKPFDKTMLILTYKTSAPSLCVYNSVEEAIEEGRKPYKYYSKELCLLHLEYINRKFMELLVSKELLKELQKLNEVFSYDSPHLPIIYKKRKSNN